MANTFLRPASYTGTMQQMTWNKGDSSPVVAYLWGAGGGGGGNDSNRGGYGSGGGYTKVNFTVNNGDVIEIAVGGGGGAGVSGRSGAPGGSAGPSYTNVIWSTLNFITDHPFTPVPVVRVTNPAYCDFLNTYGVWYEDGQPGGQFDEYNYVTFPVSGYYTFTSSVDTGIIVSFGFGNDRVILEYGGRGSWATTNQRTVYVNAGTEIVRVKGYNYGASSSITNGSMAVTITGATAAYSGGTGGAAGWSGSSGGGGGGGGATVLLVNGSVIGVAGGGGGGGGGGNRGAATGESAPGSSGQSGSYTSGQSGQNKNGDGGGGGAGGGGAYGGQGGLTPSGDQGGLAGSFGLSSGSGTNPSGRTPGGSTNSYYQSGIGVGGVNTAAGTNGYAVFEFTLSGASVNVNGTFTDIKKTWVKSGGNWVPVQQIYVNNGGTWSQVGGSPPSFNTVSGNFGSTPRP